MRSNTLPKLCKNMRILEEARKMGKKQRNSNIKTGHYEHRYKHGKQTLLISNQEIQEKVEKAKKSLNLESLAYFWLLYWTGVRKSEAYERVVEDCEIFNQKFIIDFHKRKKGSAEVPPLELPLWFPGVDLIVKQYEKRCKKPTARKLIERTHKGVRTTKYERAHWLFPHVQKQWALQIVKRILGEKYYPHFLRLNRLTEIGENPEANLTMMKSFSGIKSVKIIEDNYLGVSKRQQTKAISWMAKQINPDE